MDVVAGEEGGDGYADTCESGADYDDLHKLAVIVIFFFGYTHVQPVGLVPGLFLRDGDAHCSV